MSGKILSSYNWKDRVPNYIKLEDLTNEQRHKLVDSETLKSAITT